MSKLRTLTILACGLTLAAIALAGCGATTGTGSNGYPTVPPSQVTNTPASAASVKTATATVNGQSVTILTTSTGFTLYYDTLDTATTSACSGGCATAWPPLLSPGGTPTSTATLSGTLGVISDAHGMQVTYNGHPLYTFGNDTAPGMVTGNGVSNFFVATVNLAAQTGSGGGGSGTPTPTIGGYGYTY